MKVNIIGKHNNGETFDEDNSEVMNEVEMIALDIITSTPFKNYPDEIDDPESWAVTGPAMMASFDVLIEEAREKAENREQFFAIVEVFFREYLGRHESLFAVRFRNPDPYIDWLKDKVDKMRKEFYYKETPSKLDREYERICKLMIGGVPDFSTMIDVDVELEGLPLQDEVEAIYKAMERMDEDQMSVVRDSIQNERPELREAMNGYMEAYTALSLARFECWDEQKLASDFEYAVKERIEELEWQQLAKRGEELLRIMRDLGIDSDEDK